MDLQLYEAINNTLDFCDQLDSLGFGMNQYGYFISTKEALRASLACYFINLANMDGFVSKEELDFINIYLSEFFLIHKYCNWFLLCMKKIILQKSHQFLKYL